MSPAGSFYQLWLCQYHPTGDLLISYIFQIQQLLYPSEHYHVTVLGVRQRTLQAQLTRSRWRTARLHILLSQQGSLSGPGEMSLLSLGNFACSMIIKKVIYQSVLCYTSKYTSKSSDRQGAGSGSEREVMGQCHNK